jgi:hypothetical protein
MPDQNADRPPNAPDQEPVIQQVVALLYPLADDVRRTALAEVESRLARLAEQARRRSDAEDPLITALRAWAMLSTRTVNVIHSALEKRGMCLKDRDALRLSAVARLSRAELLEVYGCGAMTLHEVIAALEAFGMMLTPDSVPVRKQFRLPPEGVTQSAAVQAHARTEAVRQMDRDLMRLHDEDHVSYRALGERLGVTPHRVRQRVERERSRQAVAARFPRPDKSQQPNPE